MASMLSGTPQWLLKFRGLAVPFKRLCSTVWIICRVVVLPTLPVTAMTMPVNCRRFQRAHCSKARCVSSTCRTQPSSADRFRRARPRRLRPAAKCLAGRNKSPS